MPSINELIEDKLTRGNDFAGLVGVLKVDTNEYREPSEYLDEYQGKRYRRSTSVGHLEPKTVTAYSDEEEDENGDPKKIKKTVHPQRFITNYPKRIVRTAVAFLLGKSMEVSFSETNDATSEFESIFCKQLKMHSILKEFARTVFSETKSAIVFYPVPILNKEGKSEKTKLKAKVLSVKNEDEFYPHFDEYGDMDAFLHIWVSKSGNKTINHKDIYTADKIYSQINLEIYTEKENLFGKIPVVYADIDQPEWEDAVLAIDTLEVRLSRLKATNNYFSEPILKSYGATNLPSQETVGKQIEFNMEVAEDGSLVHGDADYLTWQQSVDSIKLEIEEAKDEIERGTSTPNISASSLKGLGNLSGIARRFMMLDAEVKASENMETFGPAFMRCISVVKAGISNITNISIASSLDGIDIDLSFESIIPQDIQELVDTLVAANGGQSINSQRTIVAKSPFTMDADEEMKAIEEDRKANNPIGMTF